MEDKENAAPPTAPPTRTTIRTRTATGAKQRTSLLTLTQQQGQNTESKTQTTSRRARKRMVKRTGIETKGKGKRAKQINIASTQETARVQVGELTELKEMMEAPITSSSPHNQLLEAKEGEGEHPTQATSITFNPKEESEEDGNKLMPVLRAEEPNQSPPHNSHTNPPQLDPQYIKGSADSDPGPVRQGTPNNIAHLTIPTLPDPLKPKRKKNKGRNGNIYIGVANRVNWFRLQHKFGFDNVNAFGTFVMEYMEKVYADFDTLHQVALESMLFEKEELSGFRWVNGLPHPVDSKGQFVLLPPVEMTEEQSMHIFQLSYDLAIKRGAFLVQLSQKVTEVAEEEQEDQANPQTILQIKELMDEMLETTGFKDMEDEDEGLTVPQTKDQLEVPAPQDHLSPKHSLEQGSQDLEIRNMESQEPLSADISPQSQQNNEILTN